MKFSITQGITILAAGFVFLAFVLVDKQAKVSPVPDVLPYVSIPVPDVEDVEMIDTSDWVEYRNEELGFVVDHPGELVAVDATIRGDVADYVPDGLCMSNEETIELFKRFGYGQGVCTYEVTIHDADNREVAEWVEDEEWLKWTGDTTQRYRDWIEEVDGVWEWKKIGSQQWLFVEDPDGPGGNAAYFTLNQANNLIARVWIPDILFDYAEIEMILSTFEFID